MNTQKRISANGNAAKLRSQSENRASNRGKLLIGGAGPARITAEERSPAEVPAARPARVLTERTAAQMVEANGSHQNAMLNPLLYLWAGHEMTDETALCLLCEAIADNEAALRDFTLTLKEDWRGQNLALLSIAKGIAAEARGANECFAKQNEGNVRFPSLPGLLGRREIGVRDLLNEVAPFLYEARGVIETKVIGQIADRRAALALAEALVFAENACHRAGYETDADKQSDGSFGKSRVEKLARRLLAEVMGAGGAEVADAGLVEHQENAGAVQEIEHTIKMLRGIMMVLHIKADQTGLNPSLLGAVTGALDTAANQIEMALTADGAERS